MSHLFLRGPLAALILGAATAGACLEPGAPPPGDVAPDAAVAPPPAAVPDGSFPCGRFGHVRVRDGKVMKDDMVYGRADELPGLCERAVADTLYSIGVDSSIRRWPGGVVAYKINSKMPDDLIARIDEAMEQWEDLTTISFQAYNPAVHDDYVEFSTDTHCHANIGRYNHGYVWLTDGKSPVQVRGVAIAGDEHVYHWYSDGQVTAGTSTDADAYRAVYKFTTPPGYTPNDIVEMAIAANDRVHTWWDDGKFSVGTTSDLDAHQGPLPYTNPSGKTIVGIAMAAGDVVHTWYNDGTRSIGTPQNLGAASYSYLTTAPYAFIRGIDLAGNGAAYTWYAQLGEYKRSVGTIGNLGPAGVDVRLPDDCPLTTVVHEIGHTVGLEHEQSRCDREDHIHVYYENILDDLEDNFEVVCSGYTDLTTYDFQSVMQYGSYSGSANTRPTMLRKGTLGADLTGPTPIDMAIASDDKVYIWWSDGSVTSGSSADLERHRARYPFSPPPGRSIESIVGIGIAQNNRVYTFYEDRMVSVGTTEDLDAHTEPYEYRLAEKPGGVEYTPAEVVAIGISEEDHVYAWYSDGKGSWGTSDNLGMHGPYTVTSPLDPDFDDIVGIDFSNDDTTYVWYRSGTASTGVSTNLNADNAPYPVRGRGILLYQGPGLSLLDIQGVSIMY